jgi:decaprenyl-phosphate phosphoribosyltransferase
VEFDSEIRTRPAAVHFHDNVAVEHAPGSDAPPVPAPGSGDAVPAPAAGAAGIAWGLLRATRPRQWVKNLLVLAAPFAAGMLFELDVLRATLIAFALFCALAGGVYLLNDVRDVEEDRGHPRKRHRPIAAGIVPVPLAVTVGIVLMAAALAGSVLLGTPALTAVLGCYAVISLAYSWFLKDQPVIDLAVVASGFLLRGVAGGAATGIALSQWFLLVTAFGALFMVAGKRYADVVRAGDAAAVRASLRAYSPSYLRFVWSLSAGVTCTTYSLWAFEMRGAADGVPWSALSIAPFVLAILRYAVDVDRGDAGAPEEIMLRDRVLLVFGLLWVGTVGLDILSR